jgi:hypothetical protein
VLSTATGNDVDAKVYGYLAYRSDAAANQKWRLWFYYRRASDGFETPFTPDTSLTNVKLYDPEVYTTLNEPVGAGLGGPIVSGQAAAVLGPDIVRTSRNLNTTAPLGGGGSLAGDLTLTIAAATQSVAGTMSPADKKKSDVGQSAPESLSGPGALDITKRTSLLTATGGSNAVTLADGSYPGQRKTVRAVAGYFPNSTTITPAHGTVVTFLVNNEWAEYEWDGAAWNVVGRSARPLQAFNLWGQIASLPAGVTAYLDMSCGGQAAAEAASIHVVVEHTGVFEELDVRSDTSNQAVTVRKNGVDTATTVTTAGGTNVNDAAHPFSVAAGDELTFSINNTTGAGLGPRLSITGKIRGTPPQ